jgi:hypothetical protein
MAASVSTSPAARQRAPVSVDFALQGGGAHGAFAWGVLDRMLQEPWLTIDGLSGTSAGAMNAAVLSDGLPRRGRGRAGCAGAFWRGSRTRRFSPLRRAPLDILMGRWTIDNSPAFIALDMMPPGCSRPTTPIRWASIRCATSWPSRSISRGSPAPMCKSSSPPPMCAPGARASSATPTSRRTRCWPRPACR